MKDVRQLVQRNIETLSPEVVNVTEVVGRISSADIRAVCDNPLCDESVRDGFVLCGEGTEDGEFADFVINGEIPAGTTVPSTLEDGSAGRIYTGAAIPQNGHRVVPFEQCLESGGRIKVPESVLKAPRRFIERAGSRITSGEVVFQKGHRCALVHQGLLSAAGVKEVEVVSRPRVACYCTGSELVEPGGMICPGQKISGNGFLLERLVPLFGGLVDNCAILKDDSAGMAVVLRDLVGQSYDLIITTGGMGPGKYDLVQGVFAEAGGELFFDYLPMRPGKSILFGRLGRTLFIALPGPPHAVRTLIYELVGPVILLMQGAKFPWPRSAGAFPEHEITMRRCEVTQVKDGVFSIRNGQCMVRLSERLEAGNCFMVFARGKNHYSKKDIIEIHPLYDC